MPRKPVGGVGSNQYQQRGLPRTRARGAEVSAQDVAWAFHPDRDAWTAEGFTGWAEAGPWVEARFTAADAGDWAHRAGIETTTEALAWMEAGFDHSFTAGSWKASSFEPSEARAWADAGFQRWEGSAALRDAGRSPSAAVADWDAQGFTVEQRGSMSRWFPDPRECRRWVDWIDRNYDQDNAAIQTVALQKASELTQPRKGRYDFETVAARVFTATKPWTGVQSGTGR